MCRNIIILLTTCLLLIACHENDFPETEAAELEGITCTIQEFTPDAGTRLSYAVQNSTYKATWTVNDTLGVFPDDGYQTAFPISQGAGTDKATFDGGKWRLRTRAHYAAYYPLQHPMDGISKSAIPYNYHGQEQHGNCNAAHLGQYDFLVAPYTQANKELVNFVLNHLGCIAHFQLTLPVADSCTRMTLSSEEPLFPHCCYCDITQPVPQLTCQPEEQTFVLKLTDVAVTDANLTLDLYLMLPPLNLKNQPLTITVSGSRDYSVSIPGSELKAGKVYNFIAVMS